MSVITRIIQWLSDIFENSEVESTNYFESGQNTIGSRNIHAYTDMPRLLVAIERPGRFEDVAGIADHVIAKHVVVFNLELLNEETTCRIIDFTRGVAYTNGCQMKRIANRTYICIPSYGRFEEERK